MEKAIINQKEAQKGITLIALVITIIVLLILAGVSIAMLTGQNGILTQAQNAKTTTENKSAEEKVKLAVMGARADDGTLTVGKLRTELANYGGTVEGDTFPVTATVDGKSFTVDANGNVASAGSSTVPNPPAPTGNGTLGTVTGSETKNTTVKDSLGNQVVVPAGFKVVNPTQNVTNGIVVEDVTHEATKGSQFVWIPVGEVVKEIKDGVKSTETITLGRYVFNEDGTIDTALSKTEPGDQIQPSGYSNYFTEGLKDSSTKNTHAKDIEDFKNKVTNTTHGYYIGRYEARDKSATSARTSSSVETNQLVCTANNYVYNYITQPKAAELSRGMYSDSNFESDLMNSYAWDTAINFIQNNGLRPDGTKTIDYATSTENYNENWNGKIVLNALGNIIKSKTETKRLKTGETTAKCNIFDMGGNVAEFTTELNPGTTEPCVLRGIDYYWNGPSGSRCDYTAEFEGASSGFRITLFLK